MDGVYRLAMLRSLATSVMILGACGANVQPAQPAQPPHTWTSPDQLYSVDVIAGLTPRAAQEITGFGTVNFQVFAMEAGDCSCRVAGFKYPTEVTDPAGELEHAAGVQIARMEGTATGAGELTGAHGELGADVEFTVGNGIGRGLSRTLIAAAPSRRFNAFCIAPIKADFGACERFVKSLRAL
jgi:hypothetical protein